MVEEIGGGIVSSSSTGFLGSSGKTCHTVSHFAQYQQCLFVGWPGRKW